jgi:organic hydroperoxide reductase OsmC/OhrA
MMSADEVFGVTMRLQDGYRFRVDFGQEGVPELVMDEPPPLGEGTGPNAARVLAASVGNCLSASALYCPRRAHIDVEGMRTTVEGSLARNTARCLRMRAIRMLIEPVVAEVDRPRMRGCLELFEDFCVLTQSARAGIEVRVDVEPTPSTPPA